MLEEVRKLFGYTQEELAEKVGVSQRYYTQIETGRAKSSPLIDKLSGFLKIKASFLTSLGEYIEYPFLSDFYIFNLNERLGIKSFKFINDYICSKSEYVDVVFLLLNPSTFRSIKYPPPVSHIAIRDDRNTVFLLKGFIESVRPKKAAKDLFLPEEKEDRIRKCLHVDAFREELYRLATYIHETTKIISEELYNKIENDTVGRDDIIQLLPNEDYFLRQYEAHRKVKER